MAGRIRSLYTTLLSSSLMPYLNRERADVASVLTRYASAEEGHPDSYFQQWRDACLASCTQSCAEKCGFSYLMMLESAVNLRSSIPQAYLDEMQGIADGADLPFEKILILNTFYDTMLAFRAITYYIRESQAPMLTGVRFAGAGTDGRDNDGDGQTDEDGEDAVAPFEPMPHATLAEVPTATRVVFDLHDIKLSIGVDKGDSPGVDPDTVRVRHDGIQYAYPADRGVIEVEPLEGDPLSLTVTFAPPGGFAPATVTSLVLQAGDFNRIVNPPPVHARFMRDERVTFSTEGYGKRREDIPNEGTSDGTSQPPSIAFAAAGAATGGGEPLLAQHYALLDSNTTHKHTVAFVHVPDDGTPHVVFGYAGLVWGFSGLSANGLALAFTHSDTLDNPMVGCFMRDLFDARLLMDGVPIGIVGRDLLAHQDTVTQAADVMRRVRFTFGYNVLLADAGGGLVSVETDANVHDDPAGGVRVRGPDPTGDLHGASHYVDNIEDLRTKLLVFDIKPQRFWTSFYYRSVRALSILSRRLADVRGHLDAEAAIDVLRTPDLVDTRDSMMATVLMPASRKVRYAMGQVPATSGEFLELDLRALVGGEAGE
jgi:hypothetical protein